jgi:hypothetical protein
MVSPRDKYAAIMGRARREGQKGHGKWGGWLMGAGTKSGAVVATAMSSGMGELARSCNVGRVTISRLAV